MDLYHSMVDADLDALQMRQYLEQIKTNVDTFAAKTGDQKESMQVMKLMMDWHKTHHGDKKNINVKAVHMHVHEVMSDDEMIEIFGDEE